MSGPPKAEYFLTGYKSGDSLVWDIRRPQSAMIAAYDRGLLKGKILDLGCGLCDNAIYLAARGEEVTAIDFSPDALRQAQARIDAAQLPNPAKLRTRVADALNLGPALGNETFDTALDSAMLHCFNAADQRRYVESLTPHVKVGGSMVLVVFNDRNKDPWSGPARLSQADLSQLFNATTGWRIDSIEDAEYERDLSKGVRGGPTGTGYAYLVLLERVAVPRL